MIDGKEEAALKPFFVAHVFMYTSAHKHITCRNMKQSLDNMVENQHNPLFNYQVRSHQS